MEIGEIIKEDELGGEYKIHGAPIRGHDWKLIRRIGRGTYAHIAKEDGDGSDDEIIIEQHGDNERRALFDNKTPLDIAKAAYAEILEYIS